MAKTNEGLVKYVKAMKGHPYWYGTYGQISTKALYSAKKKQYPSEYEWPCPASQLDKRVFDCVGLIKAYLWCKDINSNPVYDAKEDVSANGMLAKCRIKGKIKTLPELEGVLVFRPGHVGVYIGHGKVIEARGHKWGVVETKLKDRDFTDWGYCPWIEYKKAAKPDNKKPKSDKKGENKPLRKPDKKDIRYFKRYAGKSDSIVDALKSVGAESSYSYRAKIAKKNGIKNYRGTAQQNTKLLLLLKKGKLIKA